MDQTNKMNEGITDLLTDYIFAGISIAGTIIGLDSIPEISQVFHINIASADVSTIDVSQKIMTIASLFVSMVAGLIPIIKTIKRNKKD